ncbi:MAG: glycosyltransferase [Phycisphaerales bacterium]|nr:glycosyltransferase [Phycisphaerales bacterium]
MPNELHILLWVVGSLWLALTLIWTCGLWTLRPLPASSNPAIDNPPAERLSVIVPARNEAARIETTLRRLLAQRYADLEIIAIDDRSDDATGEIMDRIAHEDPRLHVVHVRQLPDGWLGKCHACHLGAARATGAWILFTDADVWLAEDAALRAVAAAQRDGAGHLCMLPAMHRCTPAGRAAVLAASLAGLRHVLMTNLALRPTAIGVGAFNLVRADVFRAFGGYERLRMEVVDDVKLGLLAQRAGARTRVYFGAQDAECDWADSARGLVRILEKNMFAIIGFRAWLAALILLAGAVAVGAGLVGPFTMTPAGWFAAAGLFSSVPLAWRIARMHGWSGWEALAAPLGFLTLLAAMANSTLRTLRAGGVRWRDTFYPLRDLRRGLVR